MTTTTKRRTTNELPSDLGVERAVLALMMVSGRAGLVETLDGADFYHPLHKFLFSELRAMTEAGEQMSNPHALVRWLRQPTVVKRSEGLLKSEDVASTVAEVAQEYASVALEGFYIKALRKERLRRAIRHFSLAIVRQDAADPEHPMATVDWMQKQLDGIWAKAAEIFPEEMQG